MYCRSTFSLQDNLEEMQCTTHFHLYVIILINAKTTDSFENHIHCPDSSTALKLHCKNSLIYGMGLN